MTNAPVKFLLVDDLEANLLALEGLLQREGLELWKARSGPEALELLLEHDFALALLDVQMPGMDGFELAELMRGTERTRRVPIIFLTAGALDLQRRFRGYESGAVDFLFKPIDPHILRSKAEVFFELYRQRQEVAQQRDELRAMRDQLAQSNAALEQKVQERTGRLRESMADLQHFSYTITHDLRAPLRSMHAFGQMLLTEKAGLLDQDGQDLLRRIVQSAKRMDNLILDALNYSKIVQQEMQLEPIDPGALLRGMVETYPELQPASLDITIAEPMPPVLANPAGLTQCFSNLLGNAVKFARPGQKARVRVWAEQLAPVSAPSCSLTNSLIHTSPSPPASPHEFSPPAPRPPSRLVRIWVEDEGIGIPPHQQQRVFQMFQRLDVTREGTGIGLALVRKAVERMRGRVGVESASGQGSRFWLELPAVPEG